MGTVRRSLCYQFCSGDKTKRRPGVGGRPFSFELSLYLTRKRCEQCTSHELLSDMIPQSERRSAALASRGV